MDDTLRMRRRECVGDLDPQRDQHLLLQGPAGNPVLQRFSLETLHDDEGVAVLIADVVNRADVRVTQRGRGARFALEPTERVRIASQVVRHELERHRAQKPRVLGPVHHAHSALAQLLDNAVVGDRLVDLEIAAFVRGFAAPARHAPRGDVDRPILQEFSCLALRCQQRPDFALQRLIARACVLQEGIVLGGRKVQDRLQQSLNPIPAFGVHLSCRQSVRDRATPWRPSSPALPCRSTV